MDRRKFLTRVMSITTGFGLAGAGPLAIHKLAKAGPVENENVLYTVKGFTCVTCATGLEVMLREQKGIVRARASYPEAAVVIGFDRNLTSEQALKEFIAGCGFSVICVEFFA
ncbi:MAG TPA: heavy metal-associated domain-containing protein [Candidatus Angelobacter sp.]|nr:heavy metal-associated domain-containing protein [Candidatus Angelobacter sp.]